MENHHSNEPEGEGAEPIKFEVLKLLEESKRHDLEQKTLKYQSRWTAFQAIGVTLIGTFVVGSLTAFLNHQIQYRQIEVEKERTNRELGLKEATFRAEESRAQRELEQEYLKEFVADALSDDIQRRIDFAQYVAAVTLNPEMRNLWKNYHSVLEIDLSNTRNDLLSELVKFEEKSDLTSIEIRQLRSEIVRLEGRLGISSSGSKIEFSLPVGGEVIGDFDGKENYGLDFETSLGEPVLSAADGTVAAMRSESDDSQIIVIRHENGIMSVYYGFFDSLVKRGEKVYQDQKIAEMSDGENLTLHFEVRDGLEALNPKAFLPESSIISLPGFPDFSSHADEGKYASLVMDLKTGETLFDMSADEIRHPASLTKLMTLYIAFSEIEEKNLHLDQLIEVPTKASNEPPSKLGLVAGSQVSISDLIHAVAIKSANDAATALAIAIGGSEEAFASKMNAIAKNLEMSDTTFQNAHGLTQAGHQSTARDMARLAKALYERFPNHSSIMRLHNHQTQNREIRNTCIRHLKERKNIVFCKTGYTRAAGFNIITIEEEGNTQLLVVQFGGRSSSSRNQHQTNLFNAGISKLAQLSTASD